MDYEAIKKYGKVLCIVIGLCVVLGSVWYLFGARSTDYTGTDGAIERIESNTIRATERIESAASRAGDARDAIERADRELTRSEDSAGEIQDGLNGCRDRVGRCQALNERAIGILDSIEGGSSK